LLVSAYCVDEPFANLHFCIFANASFPFSANIIQKYISICNYYNILFGEYPEKHKCKNAKMQKCKNFAVLSRRIVPYRALSLHIAPYRSSRKKNVVPLHQKNVDGGST
jgi:hypothetical protein